MFLFLLITLVIKKEKFMCENGEEIHIAGIAKKVERAQPNEASLNRRRVILSMKIWPALRVRLLGTWFRDG